MFEASKRLIKRAGLSYRSRVPYQGAREISIRAGGKEIGQLWLRFGQERFDALLWDGCGHIVGGRSSVRYEHNEQRLWTMADVERSLRRMAAQCGALSDREIPSDFILSALVEDIARLRLPHEEAHRWSAIGRAAPRIVREARDLLGRFDRERYLKLVRQMALAVHHVDTQADGAGIVMMARRCATAVEGRRVQPIPAHEWCVADELSDDRPTAQSEDSDGMSLQM